MASESEFVSRPNVEWITCQRYVSAHLDSETLFPVVLFEDIHGQPVKAILTGKAATRIVEELATAIEEWAANPERGVEL